MIHILRRAVASWLFTNIGRAVEGIKKDKLARSLQVTTKNVKSNADIAHLRIQFRDIESILGTDGLNEVAQACLNSPDLIDDNSKENIFTTTLDSEKKSVFFRFDPGYFTETVLQDVHAKGADYGFSSDYHLFTGQHGELAENVPGQTVAVEFSSPNIAKPFHAGHLRSTIIGNFIANINQALGNHVIKINYLGDWGLQFGLLGIGYKLWGSEKEFEKDPIHHLFHIYVQANRTVAEQEDLGSSHLLEEAKLLLTKMENGDPSAAALWRRFRSKSLEEYSKIYKRLNISFDDYDGESKYVEKAKQLLAMLKEAGLLLYNGEGVGYCNTMKRPDGHFERASLVKSDGSTLYLTRDLAAILERHKKYSFNRIHYVVDNGQSFHFMSMKEILRQLKHDWIDRQPNLHVKFGIVHGMSTRRGNVVFLSDILDEAKQRMLEIMKDKSSTKTTNLDEVAETLGKSAVIIQDLREKRQKGYNFDWDRMLENSGQTGVFLQYGHARLCSLEKNCGVESTGDWSASHIQEPQAQALLLHIARFDEVINEAFSKLEAYVVIHYLFQLVKLTNAAFRVLPVKIAPSDEVAQSRLQLFRASRITIANGMKLVGLQPLETM